MLRTEKNDLGRSAPYTGISINIATVILTVTEGMDDEKTKSKTNKIA